MSYIIPTLSVIPGGSLANVICWLTISPKTKLETTELGNLETFHIWADLSYLSKSFEFKRST